MAAESTTSAAEFRTPSLYMRPIRRFSDEARRAKYQGVCIVGLIVDSLGNPQRVHVVRALGMGLDEKAMEAVREYKFKPAVFKGKNVAGGSKISR